MKTSETGRYRTKQIGENDWRGEVELRVKRMFRNEVIEWWLCKRLIGLEYCMWVPRIFGSFIEAEAFILDRVTKRKLKAKPNYTTYDAKGEVST